MWKERLDRKSIGSSRFAIRNWLGGLLIFLVSGPFFCGCSFFASSRNLPYITYRIKQGDTLGALAERYGSTVRDITDWNHIGDPRRLQIGQLLNIPISRKPSARPPKTPKTNSAIVPVSADKGSLKTISLSSARKYVGKLLWPVEGARLVSRFGRRWLSFHEGLDLAAKEGTPIYAAHSGEVVYSGNGLRGYGNLIVLKAEGLLTIYGHNRRNKVRAGDRVRQGEFIAELGQTGKAEGPHVHFETRIKDSAGTYTAVDPLVFYR